MIFVLLGQSIVLEKDLDLGGHLGCNILARHGQGDSYHSESK